MNTKEASTVCVAYLQWLQNRRLHNKDVSFYEREDVMREMISKVFETTDPSKVSLLSFFKTIPQLNARFDQIKFEMSVSQMVNGEIARRYENDPIFREKYDRMMEKA